MNSRFDFLNVHRTTGVLVLLTGAVLLATLLAAARVQRWFEPVYILVVNLDADAEGETGLAEGAAGLEVDADVKMLGTTIGRVQSITLDEDKDRKLVAFARLALRGSMVRFVRTDSRAIKQGGGILGTGHIEITRGEGEELFTEGMREASIERGVSLAEDVMAEAKRIAEELVGQVRDLVTRAEEEGALGLLLGFEERRRLLDQLHDEGALGLALGPQGYEHVLSLLRVLDEEGAIRIVTGDEQAARSVVQALNALEADGPLGWLLSRSEAGASLNGILVDLRALVERLDRRGPVEILLADPERDPERAARVAAELEAILVNLRRATDVLPDLAESLGEEATSLPGVVAESQETLRQIEILVRAIQQHWLIRSYVDPRPAAGRIPLDELGIGEVR